MQLVDGVLTLHQSDISHYMKCPEQFRRENGLEPGVPWDPAFKVRIESDAALVGTALHAVIECELTQGHFNEVGEAIFWAYDWYMDSIQGFETPFIRSSFDTDEKALKVLQRLVESWWVSDERVYWLARDQSSYLVEWNFDVEFLNRGEDRPIHSVRLSGTSDIVDLQENRMIDWKSASREYQRWEYQRWAIQPTVYTFAGVQEGLLKVNTEGLTRFDYRVMVKKEGATFQEMTVWRGNGQWAWLTELCSNIADMIEAELPQWPLRDDSWWCSPKWCSAWEDCKGRFVSDDWS